MNSVRVASGTASREPSCATRSSSFVAAAGLLAAAAIPYFNINTGFSGVSTLPDSIPAKQAFDILDREFSGGLDSAGAGRYRRPR